MSFTIQAIVRFSLLAALTLSSTGESIAQQRREPSSAKLNVGIINRSPAKLLHLHVTPSNSALWGDDRLGSDTVAAGQRHALSLDRVASCLYDVRAIFDDRSQDVDVDVNLCNTKTISVDGTRSVTSLRLVRLSQRKPVALFMVQNNTTNEMTGLTSSQATEDQKMLGGVKVSAGESFIGRFRPSSGCALRFVAEFEEGEPLFRTERDICKTPLVVWNQPEKTTNVRITNRGTNPVKSVLVRPEGFNAWGSDRLGSIVLLEKQSKTIAVDTGETCRFDVKIVGDNIADEIRNNVDLCAIKTVAIEGTDLLTGRGARKSDKRDQSKFKTTLPFEVSNESPRAIKQLFASPASASEWGENLLSQPVSAGERSRLTIESDDHCLFDIKVVMAGGREQRRMNHDLCSEQPVSFGGAVEHIVDGGGPATGRSVSFVNNGKTTIRNLFLTPDKDTNWGDDRLGSNSLTPGGRLDLRIHQSGGCLWDLQIKHKSDSAREKRGIDLCAQPHQTLRLEEKTGSIASTGTGFIISANGHILTNNHVIQGCTAVTIDHGTGTAEPLKLLRQDAENDLALLKAERSGATFLTLATEQNKPRPGDRVVTLGYPLRERLGVINITDGIVSSAIGPDNDTSRIQHTAPIQPGSSGGPILNASGTVIGVVVSRFTGGGDNEQSAQNVNFGVSLKAVLALLKEADVTPSTADREAAAKAPAEIFEAARGTVLPLNCIE